MPNSSGMKGDGANTGKARSEAERNAIRAQLERILNHHTFKNSKRSVNLLRYLVDCTLGENVEFIKERTIGVEVFGRSPDYDTSIDPVVRTAATEIRKRLAQYYQENLDRRAPRIQLFSGSYIPSFEFPETAVEEPLTVSDEARALPLGMQPNVGERAVQSVEDPIRATSGLPFLKKYWLRLFGVVIVVGLLAAGIYLRRGREGATSSIDRFWGPVFSSKEPVFVCVGAINWRNLPSESSKQSGETETEQLIEGNEQPPSPSASSTDRPNVAWVDAGALSRLTALLSAHDKKFTVRASPDVALSDLRSGPVILVGLLNNPWTLRLTSGLRFHPRVEPASGNMWIEDREHPERHDWKAQWGEAYNKSTDDYAIVSRIQDSTTGSMLIELGGLSLHGTQSASEFVTDPKYLDAVLSHADHQGKNLQVVLKIAVINGEAGPPQMIAVHYW